MNNFSEFDGLKTVKINFNFGDEEVLLLVQPGGDVVKQRPDHG